MGDGGGNGEERIERWGRCLGMKEAPLFLGGGSVLFCCMIFFCRNIYLTGGSSCSIPLMVTP